MEESLKAARVVHQIVIVATTAMLIFAMSSRPPENQYTRALGELQALETNLGEIDRLRIRDFGRHNDDFLRDIRQLIGRDVQVKLGRPVEEEYSAPLRDIRALILDVAGKAGAEVRFDSRELRLALVALGSCSEPQVLVDEDEVMLGCSGLFGLATFELAARPGAPISATGLYLARIGLVEFEPSAKRGQSAHVAEVFPALQEVWNVVKQMPAVAAGTELDRRAREGSSSPKLSVLGLEMQATTAIVAGPGILIALLLYLYAHLLHIQAIAAGNETLLKSFPWLPLFDSRLSAGLTVCTLWILPSVAAVWTVWVAGLPVNYRVPLALGYVVGIGAVAFASIRKAQELNRLGDSRATAPLAKPAAAETGTAPAPTQNTELLATSGTQQGPEHSADRVNS